MTENEKMLSGDVLFENIEIVPLTESPSANPHRLLKIRGVGSRGGVVNSNNRMYPTDVLAKAVEEANSKVSKGKFVGELDHPEVGRGSLANIAMKFTRLWMEGDELKYEADVLPTAKGHQLETLIRAGVIPGMSTRGFGGLDEQEINGRSVFVVESDFELAGIDAVLEESNQFAGIASYESKGGTEMELTLEKLKTDYPELVIAITEEIEEQLTETVRADLEAEFEQKVAAALEAKKESWMEEAQKEAMESDEVKGLKAIVDAVVEAVQPVLQIETKEETDAELVAENETLKSESEAKDEKITALESENAELKSTIEERETRDKVTAKIEEKVKGHRFEETLKERLAECTSEEEVEQKFESEVGFIEKLIESTGTPSGNGEVFKKENLVLDEAKARQRTLAGIKNEEGGSQ